MERPLDNRQYDIGNTLLLTRVRTQGDMICGSMKPRCFLYLLLAALPLLAQRPASKGLNPKLVEELVLANHILAGNGVLDAYGHVSVRDDRNPFVGAPGYGFDCCYGSGNGGFWGGPGGDRSVRWLAGGSPGSPPPDDLL